jgi:hypothetical protein
LPPERRVAAMLPVRESILEDFGKLPSDRAELQVSGPAHLRLEMQQP